MCFYFTLSDRKGTILLIKRIVVPNDIWRSSGLWVADGVKAATVQAILLPLSRYFPISRQKEGTALETLLICCALEGGSYRQLLVFRMSVRTSQCQTIDLSLALTLIRMCCGFMFHCSIR